MTDYNISAKDMSMVFLSPEPFNDSFEEHLDLHTFDITKHPTTGLSFVQRNNHLYLAHMVQSTPGAKIPRWRSRLQETWLIKIGDVEVNTLVDARHAFAALHANHAKECTLLFAHPEIKHGLTNDGIPQINMDQLNNRLLMREATDDLERFMPTLPDRGARFSYRIVQDEQDEHDILNSATKVMKLTCSKLHKQSDWDEWQASEFLQLDQYKQQYMFGDPIRAPSKEAVFNLVWKYVEKVLDNRKKARCTADGSAHNGMVRVSNHTYANCVDHNGACIFYTTSAVENLIIYRLSTI